MSEQKPTSLEKEILQNGGTLVLVEVRTKKKVWRVKTPITGMALKRSTIDLVSSALRKSLYSWIHHES